MKKLLLFTFIDAFGWELLQKNIFLEGFVKKKAPLETIFGYSATCDPTILTGLLPREHGHFSFFVYDPANSPFKTARMLSLLPQSLSRRGRVRNQISRFYKKYLGYTGYFQLYNMPFRTLHKYDYTEKRDIYEPGGINSGARTIFDRLRDEKIPFYLSDWRASEAINLRVLKEQIQKADISFAYLYLAAMDATLHAHGTGSELVRAKIAWYDEQIRDIIATARHNYDSVSFFAFSDHGMTDVRSTCDLMSMMAGLPLKQNLDYAVVYDSTMARFWFLRDHAEEQIVSTLRGCSQGRILDQETLRSWGCDFSDRRYGELFFLMNPGVLLCPSFMGETKLAGMHGYDPHDRDSTAMFVSNVENCRVPARLDDLYRLMDDQINTL